MSSVHSFSWTLQLTANDLSQGPLVAVSRCTSVAQSLGEHIYRDHECEIMQPMGSARHLVRSGIAHDVTPEDRAETATAIVDTAKTALSAIAAQRVAWARLIDVARVALAHLDAVELDARALTVTARDTLEHGEAAQ